MYTSYRKLNGGTALPDQVQPKAPLLQILRVAGAQEEVFTLKEVSCQETF